MQCNVSVSTTIAILVIWALVISSKVYHISTVCVHPTILRVSYPLVASSDGSLWANWSFKLRRNWRCFSMEMRSRKPRQDRRWFYPDNGNYPVCVVKGSDLQLQNPDSPFGDGKSHFFVAESVEEIHLPSLMIRGYSGNLNHTNLGIFIMAGISGIELKNSTQKQRLPAGHEKRTSPTFNQPFHLPRANFIQFSSHPNSKHPAETFDETLGDTTGWSDRLAWRNLCSRAGMLRIGISMYIVYPWPWQWRFHAFP